MAGEIERAESELSAHELDLSRGYVIYKVQEHRVSIVQAVKGLQVYLDGKLLREAEADERQR